MLGVLMVDFEVVFLAYFNVKTLELNKKQRLFIVYRMFYTYLVRFSIFCENRLTDKFLNL